MTSPVGGTSDFARFLAGQQGGGSGGFPSQTATGAQPDYNYKDPHNHSMVPGPQGSDPTSPGAMRLAETGDYYGNQDKAQIINRMLIGSVNSPDQTLALQQQLIQAGFLNPRSRSFSPGDILQGDATYHAIDTWLDKAITTGINYNDVLDSAIKSKAGARGYDYYLKKFGVDGSGPGPAQPIPFTRSNTSLSSPQDAEAILNTTFQTFHGRNATQPEVHTFLAALNTYEAAHPTVTSGMTDPGTGGNTTSTTTGGTSAAGIAQFAQDQATTGANQKGADLHGVNQYVEAFQRAIGGVK